MQKRVIGVIYVFGISVIANWSTNTSSGCSCHLSHTGVMECGIRAGNKIVVSLVLHCFLFSIVLADLVLSFQMQAQAWIKRTNFGLCHQSNLMYANNSKCFT